MISQHGAVGSPFSDTAASRHWLGDAPEYSLKDGNREHSCWLILEKPWCSTHQHSTQAQTAIKMTLLWKTAHPASQLPAQRPP